MATYKYLNDDGVKYIFSKIKAAQTAATTAAQTAIANMKKASMVVLEYGTNLPAASESVSNVIYLLKPSASSTAYDEYVCVDVSTTSTPSWAWEKIGSTDIDLNNYIKATTPNVSGSGDAVTGISITNQVLQVTKGSVGRKVKKGTTEVAKGTDISLSDGSNNGDVQWTLNTNGTLTANVKLASWAKAANKPSYTASEVGALPSTTSLAFVPLAGTTALAGDIVPTTGSTSDSTGVSLGSTSKLFNNVYARDVCGTQLRARGSDDSSVTITSDEDDGAVITLYDGDETRRNVTLPRTSNDETIAYISNVNSAIGALNTLGSAYTTAELDALWAAAS